MLAGVPRQGDEEPRRAGQVSQALGAFEGKLPVRADSERKLIKTHIQAVAESTQAATNEEVCGLAIAAATAWIPQREPVETASPRRQATLLDGLSAAQRQLPCRG